MASMRTGGFFRLLLAALLLAAGSHTAAGQAATSAQPPPGPLFEVYAVRYATANGFAVSSLVAGADPARKIDIPFMIWVLKGPSGRIVLVDAGSYTGQTFARWNLAGAVKPSDAIGRLGLRPDEVTDIVVTHVHWDHIGGLDLFPKARVHIQRDEFTHYVDDEGKAKDRAITAEDAATLAMVRKAGRLALVEGDGKEITPGIIAYTGGKHTFCPQYVGVQTRVGTIVVASDNVYLYENLEKHLALAQTSDPAADLRVQERMLTLVRDPRFILPGHDPLVFERFPKPGGGIARID